MREFSFALLVTAPDGVPFASHLPFTVLEDARRLTTHVARGNAQWQHWDASREVLVVFQGEHALVSSRWYETAPNVPTWNYATVHAYATPRVMTDDELHAQLEALMTQHGHAQDMTELPMDYLERMRRGIVGVNLQVTRLEGKLKLSQNRSATDQARVAAKLETGIEGAQAIAARMRANLKRS